MLVKFRVNLGTQDAAKFEKSNINVKECLAGETVDIDDAAAKAFIRDGIAEEVSRVRGVAKPAEVTGVKA